MAHVWQIALLGGGLGAPEGFSKDDGR